MDKVNDQRDIDGFLAFQPCAGDFYCPFRVSVIRGDGGVIPYGRVRIDSCYHWDGGGGRTDLHDMLGIVWATSLRASGAASPGWWGYQGGGGTPELNSRLLFFDQPYASAVSEVDVELAEARIKAHTAWAAHDILDAIRFFPTCRQRATGACRRGEVRRAGAADQHGAHADWRGSRQRRVPAPVPR